MTVTYRGRKAAFFDIDGTLINVMRGQIRMTPAVREAIADLRRAGNYAFLATGRPYGLLDPELLQDVFDGMLLVNGAEVRFHDEIIIRKPLTPQTVADVTALCDRCGVEYILEGSDYVYMKKEFHILHDFFRKIGVAFDRFRYTYDLNEVPVYKMEFVSAEPGGNGAFDVMMHWPGMAHLCDPYHMKNMELYAENVTKGSAVKKVLQYLGLPREASYAFGDGLNDLEMMSSAGTALVMGNAQPTKKKKADIIVPSVDDDGVAYGIRRYILS